MDKIKLKSMARQIYYFSYIFKLFAIRQNEAIRTEETEAVEIYSYLLMKMADELYYYLNICDEQDYCPN